jgi:hypothetical protein
MARPENLLESVELRIQINPVLKGYLEQLVGKGTFGKSANEAAERLVSTAIDDMLESGKLTDANKKTG